MHADNVKEISLYGYSLHVPLGKDLNIIISQFSLKCTYHVGVMLVFLQNVNME